MLLLFPWTNIRHGQMQPILGRTWLVSRIFRAPFANLSLEIVKKMSRYYNLLSGLSRIFRKPFANVYISRKVPFRAGHFKSMPVDLDYIKPFMGFCTTLIYTPNRESPCNMSCGTILPNGNAEPRPLTRHDLATQRFPMER